MEIWQVFSKMLLAVLLVVALLVSATGTFTYAQTTSADSCPQQEPSKYQPDGASLCINAAKEAESQLTRLGALPGRGFDNLRNIEVNSVVTSNFSQCKVTEDGRFLIPDDVFTIPIKSSSVSIFAEMFESWTSVTSMTSRSINVETEAWLGGGVTASGSFSSEIKHVRETQEEGRYVTMRVQQRHARHEVKLQPDVTLSDNFKKRLLDIAANLKNYTFTENGTLESENITHARYKAQMLIRDFGTHVTTSVTAGAVLVKEDSLQSSVKTMSEEDKTSIRTSAGSSFLDVFKITATYGYESAKENTEKYTEIMSNSHVWTHGGPPLGAEPNASEWIDGLDANLVPIDRSGKPLNYLITMQLLPELPVDLIAPLETIVRETIKLYYEMNTIEGCTQPNSPNYGKSSNMNDGSCGKIATNRTFGGFFTQSDNADKQVLNPQTGAASCPDNYKAVFLTGTQCTNERGCVMEHFWCTAINGTDTLKSGYLFGGLYTHNLDNPITEAKTCPPHYSSIQWVEDLSLCISDNFELAASVALPLGGFFSCHSGNPLTSDEAVSHGGAGRDPSNLEQYLAQRNIYAKSCPEGYSQHLATVTDRGCAIHYCVKTGSFPGGYTTKIKLPPYMDPPKTAGVDAQFLQQGPTAEQQTAEDVKSQDTGNSTSSRSSPGRGSGVTVTLVALCMTSLWW